MFQGSIPALVTPMREDGSVDFEAWDRLLDFHDREGTDGVVVGGTTGESPTLEQRRTGGAGASRQGPAGRTDARDRGLRERLHGAQHRAVAGGGGGRRRRPARRHALLQPADPGGPVPALPRHRRRGRRADRALQRAGPDGLRPAAGDDCATVGPSPHRRGEGSHGRPRTRSPDPARQPARLRAAERGRSRRPPDSCGRARAA